MTPEDRDILQRLEAKLADIQSLLHGTGKGDFGLSQKVNILWRGLVLWPLLTLSAAAGSLLTFIIQRLV